MLTKSINNAITISVFVFLIIWNTIIIIIIVNDIENTITVFVFLVVWDTIVVIIVIKVIWNSIIIVIVIKGIWDTITIIVFFMVLYWFTLYSTDKSPKNLLLKPINNYKTLSCADSTSAKMVLRHFQAYNGCQQCGEEQKRPHSLYISELSGLSVLWRKRGCPMIVQLPTEYALLGFTN